MALTLKQSLLALSFNSKLRDFGNLRRRRFHLVSVQAMLISALVLFVGALLCQGQTTSGNLTDCRVTYEFEGSRLDICNVGVRQELLHPDAKRHHIEVYGYLVNRSSHLWARVRFEITLSGVDSDSGKEERHSWIVVRNMIHKEVPEKFEEWFPPSVSRGSYFRNPVVSVRVIDDYTFPRVELLDQAIEEESRAQRQLQAKRAAELKRLSDQRDAQLRQKRSELVIACSKIHQATISKRVVDLTVREADQIAACKALGMYR